MRFTDTRSLIYNPVCQNGISFGPEKCQGSEHYLRPAPIWGQTS